MKKITLISAFALAALVCTPFVHAEDKPAAKTEKSSKSAQKYTPYAGTVDSVDKAAKTVTIKAKSGDQVLTVTDTTKIENVVTKKAATLDDVAAGAYITGSFEKKGDTLEAHSIHLGKDAPAEKPAKKGKAKATPAADKPADAPAEKPAAPAEAK